MNKLSEIAGKIKQTASAAKLNISRATEKVLDSIKSINIKDTRAAILLLLVLASPACCDDNGNNDPDGSPDTDTDTDTDTGNCENVDYDFNSVPAAKCFCPGDGDQVIEITEEEILAKFTDPNTIERLRKLIGIKMNIPEGTSNKCAVGALISGNITTSLTGNENGAMVDPQHPEDIVVNQDAVEFRVSSADDPYGPEIELAKDITLEFPERFGTVYKWITSGTPHFEIVEPTIIDATGVKYITPSLSPYAVKNRPFSDYSVNFVPGSTNGYDINDDGVLVELTLKDEEKDNPTWVKFSVTDGTDTYTMTPTGEPEKYRVAVFDKHDLTFQVADNNKEASEQHTDEVTKAFDPTVDLCEDVVCEDDGNACNGEEACDPTDGECKSFDPVTCPDDGDLCNGDEECNPSDGSCIHVDPLACDDEDACNGVETCIPATGCTNPPDLVCDDGFACTGVETCDTATGCTNPADVDCGDHGACVETPTPGTCDCEDGFGGEHCETALPVEISGLQIECGAEPCWAGGTTYPVTFSVENATSCTANAVRIVGSGTSGSVSAVTLDGNSGSFTYTTGSNASNVIRITVECDGPGGSDSQYIDVTLE